MSRTTRHTIAVVLLALAGLVVAVVLGVVVSRAASQSVALGSADLGSGRHLVVTTVTTATRTVTRTATVPTTTSTPTTTRTATTTSTPTGADDHGGGSGGPGDGDSDD